MCTLVCVCVRSRHGVCLCTQFYTVRAQFCTADAHGRTVHTCTVFSLLLLYIYYASVCVCVYSSDTHCTLRILQFVCWLFARLHVRTDRSAYIVDRLLGNKFASACCQSCPAQCTQVEHYFFGSITIARPFEQGVGCDNIQSRLGREVLANTCLSPLHQG